ncbi:hypothetical protein Q8A73_014639 [Channa argus]|nr:hypothetical protein Q8A73_014639 [Channa argus]
MPNHRSSWAKVVVCGRKTDVDVGASLTDVGLSNRYASSHPADALLDLPDLEPPPSLVSADSAACPHEDTASVQITQPLTVKQTPRPLSRESASSAHRRILREVVLRHSGGASSSESAGIKSYPS